MITNIKLFTLSDNNVNGSIIMVRLIPEVFKKIKLKILNNKGVYRICLQ